MSTTKSRFRVLDLKTRGPAGWSWAVRWADPPEAPRDHDPGRAPREFKTGLDGTGLWILGTDGDWHQLLEDGDFWLSKDRTRARCKIRKHFEGS